MLLRGNLFNNIQTICAPGVDSFTQLSDKQIFRFLKDLFGGAVIINKPSHLPRFHCTLLCCPNHLTTQSLNTALYGSGYVLKLVFVSEDRYHLSCALDTTRMNSSWDRAGRFFRTRLLRSCCRRRIAQGWVSWLVCTVQICPAGVVHTAAGQMLICILVRFRKPIHHKFVRLLLTVSRQNTLSLTGNLCEHFYC